MNEKKISVIIPVYNVEKYLPHCLDSVVHQTHRNLEIILIDDGSADNSGAICDEYAAKDSRIICRHQRNSGVSKARNYGLSLASGDYYHFLDSDDFLELDAYEYLLREMDHVGAEAAGFGYFITYPEREIACPRRDDEIGVFDTEGTLYQHLFAGSNFVCTKLISAKAIGALRFHEDIYRDEDTLFGTMALRNVRKSVFVSRPLLHYVQSEESACRGVFRPSQLSAVKVIPIMERFLSEEHPQWLNRWRIGYMQLMIMLYGDMYLDKVSYEKEQKEIYSEFLTLYRKTERKNIQSRKTRIKLLIFKQSPKLFCWIHKRIHNL